MYAHISFNVLSYPYLWHNASGHPDVLSRNAAEGLADAKLRIPPVEVRFPTEEEAKAYGLTMMDPVYEECASDTAKSRLTAQVVLQCASFA